MPEQYNVEGLKLHSSYYESCRVFTLQTQLTCRNSESTRNASFPARNHTQPKFSPFAHNSTKWDAEGFQKMSQFSVQTNKFYSCFTNYHPRYVSPYCSTNLPYCKSSANLMIRNLIIRNLPGFLLLFYFQTLFKLMHYVQLATIFHYSIWFLPCDSFNPCHAHSYSHRSPD